MASNPAYEKFGAMLREMRKEYGLTQRKMASKIGIMQPQLSRLEAGVQGVRFSVLLRLAKCCNCRPSHLLAAAGL